MWVIASQYLPLKSPKNNRRSDTIAYPAVTDNQIVPEHRQRDEAREPKQHGDCINANQGEFVCCSGEEARCEGEVEDGENCP